MLTSENECLALLVETFPEQLFIFRKPQFCFWPNEALQGFSVKNGQAINSNLGQDFDCLNVFY